jgi:hypothetical protein
MPDRSMHHPHGRSNAWSLPVRATVMALFLVVAVITPASAADPSPSPSSSPEASASPDVSPSPSPSPTLEPMPEPTPEPTAVEPPAPPAPAVHVAADPTLTVAMTQSAVSYDSTTNRARVQVTVTPTGATAPWSYAIATRGVNVATGSSSAASITVTVTNECSITTQSITTQVTDAGGATASAAGTLDRTLCPPPPNYPHARDRILAGPTLTENSFVDRLRAVGSPALAEGRAIYRTLVSGGVNPAFALGTFHAESHSGTRGYATVTKNWGNILFWSWTVDFGATAYRPGNGYTYARFPTWHHSIRAYVDLLQRYHRSGYTTVSSASAHWLGTIEGSERHLRYLNNITAVMRILPDDAIPVMTALAVPSRSRAAVAVSWSARDNLAVTGYQLRYRPGHTGAWSAIQTFTTRSATVTLGGGWWTIAVRATDAAGNVSSWRTDIVYVDALLPTMTALSTSMVVVRTVDGRIDAKWSATDNVGVTGYQWRAQRPGTPKGPAWSITTGGRSFGFRVGTWELEVRARDAVGNWSDWRATRLIVPADDRAFTFSAGTVRATSSTAYLGTLTSTSHSGAQMVATSTDGTAFYLIGRVGPQYGKLQVTVDGVSTIVDTAYYKGVRRTTNLDRVLLFSTNLAAGPHSVTITALGTTNRPTIAIDALDFAR